MDDTLSQYLAFYDSLDHAELRQIIDTKTAFIEDYPKIRDGIGAIVPTDKILALLNIMDNDDTPKQTALLLKYLTAVIDEHINDLPHCAAMLGLKYDASEEDPDFVEILSRLPR